MSDWINPPPDVALRELAGYMELHTTENDPRMEVDAGMVALLRTAADMLLAQDRALNVILHEAFAAKAKKKGSGKGEQ